MVHRCGFATFELQRLAKNAWSDLGFNIQRKHQRSWLHCPQQIHKASTDWRLRKKRLTTTRKTHVFYRIRSSQTIFAPVQPNTWICRNRWRASFIATKNQKPSLKYAENHGKEPNPLKNHLRVSKHNRRHLYDIAISEALLDTNVPFLSQNAQEYGTTHLQSSAKSQLNGAHTYEIGRRGRTRVFGNIHYPEEQESGNHLYMRGAALALFLLPNLGMWMNWVLHSSGVLGSIKMSRHLRTRFVFSQPFSSLFQPGVKKRSGSNWKNHLAMADLFLRDNYKATWSRSKTYSS